MVEVIPPLFTSRVLEHQAAPGELQLVSVRILLHELPGLVDGCKVEKGAPFGLPRDFVVVHSHADWSAEVLKVRSHLGFSHVDALLFDFFFRREEGSAGLSFKVSSRVELRRVTGPGCWEIVGREGGGDFFYLFFLAGGDSGSSARSFFPPDSRRRNCGIHVVYIQIRHCMRVHRCTRKLRWCE